ncbi:MAG: GntR family transcriptional regulator [Arthrobacter sp.]|nr:GntR family transcriptional regulator [Arthrobacter sp.]MCU1540451.1 GntR family transcriptional regulator [Arthrobacter sp.]
MSNHLQRPAQLTAPETAYRWLRDAISALPWDEEAFLSENAVAEASGTSRTPVREALLRLEASGLIRRVPHKGAYVPALSARDIETMMEARQLIEEWAVRKVTASHRSMDDLNRLLEQQGETLADPVAFIECDIRFHKYIIEAAGNPVLQDVYDSQRFKQLRMGVKAVVDSEGRSDHVLREHRSIVEAIMTGNPDVAVAAVRDHLSSTLAALKASPSGSGR